MGLFFSEHVWDEVVPFPETLWSLCVKLLGLEGSLFSEETIGLVTWKSLVTKCLEWLLQLVNITYIIILSVFNYLSSHFYAVLPASFFCYFLLLLFTFVLEEKCLVQLYYWILVVALGRSHQGDTLQHKFIRLQNWPPHGLVATAHYVLPSYGLEAWLQCPIFELENSSWYFAGRT